MTRFRLGPGCCWYRRVHRPGHHRDRQHGRAGYGAALLWTIVFSVAATIVLQDMAARVGIAGDRVWPSRSAPASPRRCSEARSSWLIAVTILLGNAAFQAGNLLGASLGFQRADRAGTRV